MILRSLQKSCWFGMICFVIAIGCDQGETPIVASNDSQPIRSGEQVVEQHGKDDSSHDNSIVLDGFVIHTPVVHENLTIFPVSRVEPNMEDRFITLDEGLKNGTVEVFELGAGRANVQPNADGGLHPAVSDEDSFAASPATPDSAVQANEEQAVGVEANPGSEPDQLIQANQGNSVNQVYVLNRSDRPLYLMPGEIILGGDQDRTIGEELVIAPSKEPVEVEVFCVEHGRWGGRSVERTTQELEAAFSNSASASSVAANLTMPSEENGNASPGQSAQQLSEQAENGKFIASVGVLTKKARLAAQGDKDQGKVWEEVAVANASAKSQIDSGAFTQNYVHDDNIKRFEAFVGALQDEVARTDSVVGVVVAVNGKIDAADVFESTPLFKKLWPKLLKSYSLEAANRAAESVDLENAIEVAEGDAGEKPTTTNDTADRESQLAACTLQDAVAFLQQAKAANEKSSDMKEGQAISHRSDESLDSFSLRFENPDAAAGGGGFGGGGFGGAVHFSGFSK